MLRYMYTTLIVLFKHSSKVPLPSPAQKKINIVRDVGGGGGMNAMKNARFASVRAEVSQDFSQGLWVWLVKCIPLTLILPFWRIFRAAAIKEAFVEY